jgi:hypothetical protein
MMTENAAGAARMRAMTLLLTGAWVLIGASESLASVDIRPLASVSVLHNSNVFARPSDQPPFASSGNTELGDTIERYLVGATADIGIGRDKLSLSAQGSRFEFNRFDQLNHFETRFGGDFSWQLGSMLDGSLDYSQSRLMAPLADTFSETLQIQTERIAKGSVRLLVTPQWRIDLNPGWHELESPLPQFPEFGFKEGGGAVSINYVGINRLTAGLREDILNGSYHHIVAATRYHQNTTELTANYAITNFSSVESQVGYTQRHNSLVNPDEAANVPTTGGVIGRTSAFTGSLGFRRRISVKTSVHMSVFREVNSYVAGANAEIGTGGDIGARWDPDVKISITADYRYTRQAIQGGLAISGFETRADTARHAELGIDYHALRWLTFRPYAVYDRRSSNFHEANFSSSVFGIDITAQLNPPAQQ